VREKGVTVSLAMIVRDEQRTLARDEGVTVEHRPEEESFDEQTPV
jgi:hypothetical protein